MQTFNTNNYRFELQEGTVTETEYKTNSNYSETVINPARQNTVVWVAKDQTGAYKGGGTKIIKTTGELEAKSSSFTRNYAKLRFENRTEILNEETRTYRHTTRTTHYGEKGSVPGKTSSETYKNHHYHWWNNNPVNEKDKGARCQSLRVYGKYPGETKKLLLFEILRVEGRNGEIMWSDSTPYSYVGGVAIIKTKPAGGTNQMLLHLKELRGKGAPWKFFGGLGITLTALLGLISLKTPELRAPTFWLGIASLSLWKTGSSCWMREKPKWEALEKLWEWIEQESLSIIRSKICKNPHEPDMQALNWETNSSWTLFWSTLALFSIGGAILSWS